MTIPTILPQQGKSLSRAVGTAPLVDIPQLGPERATLRRLAESLGECLTPLVVGTGAVGAYRAATAPVPMLLLLDYVDELERQLAQASPGPGPQSGRIFDTTAPDGIVATT